MFFNEQLDSKKEAIHAKNTHTSTSVDVPTTTGVSETGALVRTRVSVPLWQQQQTRIAQAIQDDGKGVFAPDGDTHTHTHTHTRKKRRTGIDQGGGTFRTVGVTVSGLCVCVMCERKFKSQLHMRRHESHSNMHKRNIIIRQEYLDAQQKDNNDLYTHIHTHTHTSAVETA
eukprot:GHVR01006929.1.p1 GENE.GHVR01006929.1~~GHVR01006929.1.p1  ORF type:complete len:171 (+),score=98.62 GHVR01006929.1:277-789(+)